MQVYIRPDLYYYYHYCSTLLLYYCYCYGVFKYYPPLTVTYTISLSLQSIGAAGGESPEEDPHYFDKLPHRSRAAAADQWAWIEAQLQASTAQYVFVGGHYSL